MPTKHRFEPLETQARRLAAVDLRSMLQADPTRTGDFALRVGPLYANFARQRYDRVALDALFDQLAAAGGTGRLRSLFDGEQVNPTEGRPALHTALRGDLSPAAVARDAHAQAQAARLRMRELIATLAAAGVTDIVSVGIGGDFYLLWGIHEDATEAALAPRLVARIWPLADLALSFSARTHLLHSDGLGLGTQRDGSAGPPLLISTGITWRFF